MLPGPDFADLKPVLSERLARLGDSIRAEQFAGLLDPLFCHVLRQGFVEAGADEGTLWLPDEESRHLVPVYNSGPAAAELVGRFKQPLSDGLISMVFASEQSFLENEVSKNAQQSKLLDGMLQTQTCAMIAVPFYFLRACRGVLSCVQLKHPGSAASAPPGFRPEHLSCIERTGAVASQLIEFRLLSCAVGWS
jgi:hypothetical protein